MAENGIRRTSGRGRLFDSVLDTIGDTPVIRVNNLAPDGVRMYVKAEAFNPAASVKDRLAVNIIEAAERSGALKARPDGRRGHQRQHRHRPGDGLRAERAIRLWSPWRTVFRSSGGRLMRILGAKVVLTPRAEKGFGMYKKAVELAEKHGWFLAHQFETEANADIHEVTTAQEIMADFAGDRLDYVVTGYGTGGTVTGLGRVLRKERPDTKIILSEPANAALVSSGHAQERLDDGAPAVSHPEFEPHPIQGWTPDFIPLVLQEAIDKGVLMTTSSPWRGPMGSSGRGNWRRKRGSLPGCPEAPPLRSPWIWRRKQSPEVSSWPCCRIPVNAI